MGEPLRPIPARAGAVNPRSLAEPPYPLPVGPRLHAGPTGIRTAADENGERWRSLLSRDTRARARIALLDRLASRGVEPDAAARVARDVVALRALTEVDVDRCVRAITDRRRPEPPARALADVDRVVSAVQLGLGAGGSSPAAGDPSAVGAPRRGLLSRGPMILAPEPVATLVIEGDPDPDELRGLPALLRRARTRRVHVVFDGSAPVAAAATVVRALARAGFTAGLRLPLAAAASALARRLPARFLEVRVGAAESGELERLFDRARRVGVRIGIELDIDGNAPQLGGVVNALVAAADVVCGVALPRPEAEASPAARRSLVAAAAELAVELPGQAGFEHARCAAYGLAWVDRLGRAPALENPDPAPRPVVTPRMRLDDLVALSGEWVHSPISLAEAGERALVDAAPDAGVRTGEDGRLLVFSTALRRVFDLPHDPAIAALLEGLRTPRRVRDAGGRAWVARLADMGLVRRLRR